ncbi:MAG: NAD(P)-dependent oxidoreductase [Ferroplasma sp.]
MLFSLNLKNKKILFVGGGKIAERKIIKLLEEKPSIDIISVNVTEKLEKLEKDGFVKIRKKQFEDDDIGDYDIVFCTSSDRKLNCHIASICQCKKIMHDNASDHNDSDIMMVACVNIRDINIGISTSGKKPALSKELKVHLLSDMAHDTFNFEIAVKQIYKNGIEHYEDSRQ